MCVFTSNCFLGSERERDMNIQLEQRPYKLFTHAK